MCGIAGIVDWGHGVYQNEVSQMCDIMYRRGPDYGRQEQLKGACLGHRRLAIIDLSLDSSQPFSDTDGRYHLVFNGEIYGFAHLREALLEEGCRLRTESDTEVIIEGFKSWGLFELCQKMNGMFAFAIWDEVEQRLFVGRDRYGEKPFYYRFKEGKLLFASSARALYFQNEKPRLSSLGLYAYLHQAFTLPSYPVIDDLQALEPATCGEILANGEIKVQTYWKPNFEPKRDYDAETWISKVEKSLEEVIAEELVSDVAIGALLSGGVDSSLIASIATEYRSDLDLFTVRMPNSDLDESEIAKTTAKKIGGVHHIIEASQMSLDDFYKFQSTFAEPLGDSSSLGMFMVSEAARKQVTVVLTGDGGDELFAGYNTVKLHVDFNRYKRLFNNPLGKAGDAILQSIIKPLSDKGIIRRISTLSHIVTHSTEEVHTRRSFVPRNLQGKLNAHLGPSNEKLFRQRVYEIWNRSDAYNEIDKLMAFDLRHVLLGDFIPKVDVSTMFHSLEARAPFLHHKLGDLAFSAPLDIKRMGDTQKGITKRILERRLGKETSANIIQGKRGFVLPVDHWINGKWAALLEDLRNSELVKDGYLDEKFIHQVIDGFKVSPSTYSRLRYSLICLESWYRSFNTGAK